MPWARFPYRRPVCGIAGHAVASAQHRPSCAGQRIAGTVRAQCRTSRSADVHRRKSGRRPAPTFGWPRAHAPPTQSRRCSVWPLVLSRSRSAAKPTSAWLSPGSAAWREPNPGQNKAADRGIACAATTTPPTSEALWMRLRRGPKSPSDARRKAVLRGDPITLTRRVAPTLIRRVAQARCAGEVYSGEVSRASRRTGPRTDAMF